MSEVIPIKTKEMFNYLMSFDWSDRLLTSTNGTCAIENDLPRSLLKKLKDQDTEISINSKCEWQKYIKCSVDGEVGVLPFLSFSTTAEGVEAEQKLDVFTKEVLIPLCIKTSAVVICTPTKACSLGMSFGKAASFLAPTFEGYSLFDSSQCSWSLFLFFVLSAEASFPSVC